MGDVHPQEFNGVENKANRHKSRALSYQQPTDSLTDGLTNKAAYRVTCMRLKMDESQTEKKGLIFSLTLKSGFDIFSFTPFLYKKKKDPEREKKVRFLADSC